MSRKASLEVHTKFRADVCLLEVRELSEGNNFAMSVRDSTCQNPDSIDQQGKSPTCVYLA